MGRRVAGIDVGTNSFLLAIVEGPASDLTVVHDRSDIVRLGEGVDRTRKLSRDAWDRALAMLGEYAQTCRRYEVAAIRATGTSVLRDAADAAGFVKAVEVRTGIAIEVISGEREAELTYADVAASHGRPGEELVLFDIGGGSTEVVRGVDGRIAARRSFDVGSNRLTERLGAADPPTTADLERCRELADQALAEVAPASGRVAGSGGTITTLAAIHHAMTEYRPDVIGATVLTREIVAGLLARLAAVPLEERRRVPGLPPQRAEVMVVGTILVERVLEHLGAEAVAVSAGGLRFALAREALAALEA